MNTRAPSAANVLAMPRPIPEVPPVTTAILPSSVLLMSAAPTCVPKFFLTVRSTTYKFWTGPSRTGGAVATGRLAVQAGSITPSFDAVRLLSQQGVDRPGQEHRSQVGEAGRDRLRRGIRS